MDKIVFKDVHKRFDDFEAVRGVSFAVGEGETLVLIGTSGCGKTTTLKMINRLVEPTSGVIEVDGADVTGRDVTELRRSIGYVIQSVGLFPHLTIGRNIAVVPEMLGWAREKISSRVDELLEMVGLDPGVHRDRYPAELSGGQQQRVGVARALAADPPVVLMDEPFGALDPITREQLQGEFLSLVEKIKKTIVFVTHDIFEAFNIADRVALMDEGRIIQTGTPREIVEGPENQLVVDFLGRHRFQLTLLLMDLTEVMEEPAGGDEAAFAEGETMDPEATILDALNYLKRTGAEVIPVEGADGGRAVVRMGAVKERIFSALEDAAG